MIGEPDEGLKVPIVRGARVRGFAPRQSYPGSVRRVKCASQQHPSLFLQTRILFGLATAGRGMTAGEITFLCLHSKIPTELRDEALEALVSEGRLTVREVRVPSRPGTHSRFYELARTVGQEGGEP